MITHSSMPYTNNASGNLNKQKEKNKYTLIDLDGLDVEMISPHFLQSKTLKKPLREFEISAIKTNPNGFRQSGYYNNQPPTKEYPSAVIFKKDEIQPTKKKESSLSLIDTSSLSIKPAFKRDETNILAFAANNTTEVTIQKDRNTILSAMIRKGMKPQTVIKPEVLIPKEQKKVGPAEAKLKAMMGKASQKGTSKREPAIEKQVSRRQSKKQDNSSIGEEINQEFDEYGNQSFEKISGAYESIIKQSIIGESIIRESLAGDSNIRQSIAEESIIKESIRESIRQSLASSGKIKESIRQDIRQSFQSSSRSLKEEIIEQISASHRRSKESIEQVYQQIFEEQSLQNSLTKSQNKFKKSMKVESDSLSQSASKSFRMKTNIAKSLKFAEELSKKGKEGKQSKIETANDKRIAESIGNEKQSIKRIHENITKLLSKKSTTITSERNKDLYYNFKIQINKLLTGDQFQSKLKKLVSFLTVGDEILPNKKYVDELEDNILKNIMSQVENIKVGKSQLSQIQKIKKEYEDKLTEGLRIQEVNLRAEMNQKLSEKDLELKKMIAELESRMMSRTVQGGGYGREEFNKSQQFEVESDYSIDSDNISWKADLWQLLPEYEKKKLYEKQTAEVTKFLADVMINEIKQEALERSLDDISFEFPYEYIVPASNQQPPRQDRMDKEKPQQRSFTKKQTQFKPQRSQFLSDLPKLSVKKQPQDESKSFDVSKQEYQTTKFEPVHKDEKIKSEVIKLLSDYKNIYLKKKQEVVKNLMRVLTSKSSEVQNCMYSSLQQITILSERQFKKEHQMYVRAYEEELIMNLTSLYTRSLNKKQSAVEEQMKKMYDRLVVVCQIATAEKCSERISLDVEKDAEFNVQALTKNALRKMELTSCPIEILANENYMELKTKKEEKQIKNQLVEQIVQLLSSEFAKEFPKKKK